jgi:hypothetical protein
LVTPLLNISAFIINALQAHDNLDVNILPSVHCAGLLNVHGASLYVAAANALGAAGKLKVIHAVTT